MKLLSLTLEGFRNYRKEVFLPAKGVNLVLGENGAGKTNLLEAVYYLSCMRSHRTHKDAELLLKEDFLPTDDSRLLSGTEPSFDELLKKKAW